MGAASAAYCALSAGSKPIEEVPKVIPAWQDGAWKARYARENLRRAPCRASSAPQWRRYLAEWSRQPTPQMRPQLGASSAWPRTWPSPVAADGMIMMDVQAAFREGAHALPADFGILSEPPEDGSGLHVGLRRKALRVEFARLGKVLPIHFHFVRPRVCAPGDALLLDHGVAAGGGGHVDDLHVV